MNSAIGDHCVVAMRDQQPQPILAGEILGTNPHGLTLAYEGGVLDIPWTSIVYVSRETPE